jgi:hypothetical protein
MVQKPFAVEKAANCLLQIIFSVTWHYFTGFIPARDIISGASIFLDS